MPHRIPILASLEPMLPLASFHPDHLTAPLLGEGEGERARLIFHLGWLQAGSDYDAAATLARISDQINKGAQIGRWNLADFADASHPPPHAKMAAGEARDFMLQLRSFNGSGFLDECAAGAPAIEMTSVGVYDGAPAMHEALGLAAARMCRSMIERELPKTEPGITLLPSCREVGWLRFQGDLDRRRLMALAASEIEAAEISETTPPAASRLGRASL